MPQRTLTEEYFNKLQQDRIERDNEIEHLKRSSYNKGTIHEHCIKLEQEYLAKAYPNSVKIYNQLSSDEAKEKFSKIFTILIGDLCKEKNGVLSHYNDCKDFLDSVNGVIMARDEGIGWDALVEMFEQAYKGRYCPFTKHEDNPYISLWNNFAEIAKHEVQIEKDNSIKNK